MILKKLLSIALLSLVLFSQASSAMAQATPPEPDLPKVMKDCGKLKPKYPGADKLDFSKPYTNKFELNFRVAFEKASNQYHLYVECAFENMVSEMLGAAGGNISAIFAANAPNLPEWMNPTSACLKEDMLASLLKGGSPETLVEPLLKEYNRYVDHLLVLTNEARGNASVVEDGRQIQISEINARRLFLKTLVENEIQDSLVALDGALNGLKEMRKAFAMHVHFQCMLRNLELYRHAMENMRTVVSALPAVIQNASMH